MSAGEPFIDISIRQGLFSRNQEMKKRIFLPLSWQANRSKWKLLAMPFFLWLLVLASAGMIYNGWHIIGIAVMACSSFMTYIFGRSMLARLKIGPGRVTIGQDGFSDERLGPDRISWHCLHVVVTHHRRRNGPPIGISLGLDHDIALNEATVSLSDYKKAYFLLTLKTNRIVFIDFADQRNSVEIEQAIRALVKAAVPRRGSQAEARPQ